MLRVKLFFQENNVMRDIFIKETEMAGGEAHETQP